jgi:hypothetical protein
MKRVLAVALAGIAAACNSNSNTLQPPAAPVITDTFAGTVPVHGQFFSKFTVGQSGEVDITLTSAVQQDPTHLATIQMGVAVGVPTATACPPPFSQNVPLVQASPNVAESAFLGAGTYCVAVYDSGNQSAPVDVTGTVAHP